MSDFGSGASFERHCASSPSVSRSSSKAQQMLGITDVNTTTDHHQHIPVPASYSNTNANLMMAMGVPKSSLSRSGDHLHHPLDTRPQKDKTSGTLKKARSLFSSNRSKSSDNHAHHNGYASDLPSPPPLPTNNMISSYDSLSWSHSKSHGSLTSPHSSLSGFKYPASSSMTFSHPHTSPKRQQQQQQQPYFNATQSSPNHYSHAHPYANSVATMHRPSSQPNTEGRNRSKAYEEEDVNCPICLESLSIRLQGEKPHVVPVCGHKLHAECFETAYGVPASPTSSNDLASLIGGVRKPQQKKAPIGICGICRSEMKISEGGDTGKSKFAAISGQPGRSGSSPTLDTHKLHSISKRTIDADDLGVSSLHDPSEDQDIVNPHQYLPAYMQHIALNPSRHDLSAAYSGMATVEPKITVRAEHSTITRSADPQKKIHMTCMVTVEVPSRIPALNAHPKNKIVASHARQQQQQHQHSPYALHHGPSNSQSTILPGSSELLRRESNATHNTTVSSMTEDFPTSPSVSGVSTSTHANALGTSNPARSVQNISSSLMEKTVSANTNSSSGVASSSHDTPGTTHSSTFTSIASFPSVPGSNTHPSEDDVIHVKDYALAGSSSTTPASPDQAPLSAAQIEKEREAHGPFAAVFEDLQRRMADWKGHQPANFGSLRMWDSLQVKKDRNIREFVVYLFEEALLCVVDDKRRGYGDEASDKLRLKGRVFVRHMKQVDDTSAASGDLSLTIQMEDDSLESFVILFPTRDTLEVWRSQIQALIDHHRPPIAQPKSAVSAQSKDSESRRDSIFSSGTSRSGQSGVSRFTKATTAPSLTGSSMKAGLGIQDLDIPPVPTMVSAGPRFSSAVNDAIANWQAPEPHAFVPLDLMLVVSVPPSRVMGPSSTALKLSIIRQTLDFVIHSVGPRARIAIVTYTVGDAQSGAGSLKKTPWLAVGNPAGLKRLEQVVSDIVGDPEGRYHEAGLVTVDDPKEDKITVASAVNLALDVILQRQSRSATSGMLLLNEGKDGAQKHHIDLLMARADAGGVPIHSIGWGKTHDPSSLWLLSNHTRGTYTFVKDFYQLKEAVAGCVGGMLSVAIGSLKLHLTVQERRWFKIRKVAGVGSAIVSSDGFNVDINLGELRFGEKKEMLVEIEMASPQQQQTQARTSEVHESALRRKASMTATDDFFLKRIGMDPGSFSDLQQDFFEEVEDGMADDVPIFEVRATYKDPMDVTNANRKLPYPTLLTTTVAPPSPKGADSPSSPTSSTSVSDPTIVRRRMELLTSDMITRTLLLMSRRQDSQAQRLLSETTRIFGAIIANLIPPSMDDSKITPDARYANEVLLACLQDIEHLRLGCEDGAEFDHLTRNFGAQQAVALRDQRAWTDRTATEALFFCPEWTAIFGKALSSTSY